MSAAQLSEEVRNLIEDQIKANIVAELAAIRTNRADPSVNVSPPKSYFIFPMAHTYRCPAIFTVVDSGEVPEKETGANFVDCVFKVIVSAVVEDKSQGSLTVLAERYQAALFKILHWQRLLTADQSLKIWIRIERFRFSPIFTEKRADGVLGEFRKEVALDLEVKSWENPTS